MKRRSFLKSLFGAATAIATPAFALNAFKEASEEVIGLPSGSKVGILTPGIYHNVTLSVNRNGVEVLLDGNKVDYVSGILFTISPDSGKIEISTSKDHGVKIKNSTTLINLKREFSVSTYIKIPEQESLLNRDSRLCEIVAFS